MTHISFSFHADGESRFSHRNDDDIVQPTLTRETGKEIPVKDDAGNQIGTGIISGITVHENALSDGAEITVVMEVQFTEPREPRLLWDLAGFSIGSDQAIPAGKHRNDEER
jgi:hypothetical protein